MGVQADSLRDVGRQVLFSNGGNIYLKIVMHDESGIENRLQVMVEGLIA